MIWFGAIAAPIVALLILVLRRIDFVRPEVEREELSRLFREHRIRMPDQIARDVQRAVNSSDEAEPDAIDLAAEDSLHVGKSGEE